MSTIYQSKKILNRFKAIIQIEPEFLEILVKLLDDYLIKYENLKENKLDISIPRLIILRKLLKTKFEHITTTMLKMSKQNKLKL